MIKYNLKCKNKHEFESWFSDSKEFERLKQNSLIECVFCNTKKIEVLSNVSLRKKLKSNMNELNLNEYDISVTRTFLDLTHNKFVH